MYNMNCVTQLFLPEIDQNGCRDPFPKSSKWMSRSVSFFFCFFSETDAEIYFVKV